MPHGDHVDFDGRMFQFEDVTIEPKPAALDPRALFKKLSPSVFKLEASRSEGAAQGSAVAITTTDVAILGRLGPDALAAGSLGSNLYFLPMIFGLGLMLAASPMIATELGRRRHSVRDVRRTVRQGLWIAVIVAIPIWMRVLVIRAGAIAACAAILAPQAATDQLFLTDPDFKRAPIGANDPLRTGTYAKTLTFTLSTTTP